MYLFQDTPVLPAGDLGPNKHLVGTRCIDALNTPALILELPAFEANLIKMREFAHSENIFVRPHIKSHKSIHIAKLQIESGAIGICCTTIGEAEIMGNAGINSILITSPLTTQQKVERFSALHETVDWLGVVADHPQNLEQLSLAAQANDRRFNIVVDIDPGMHRTGARSIEDALALVTMCDSSGNLNYVGLQCYDGIAQHVEPFAARKQAALNSLERLTALLARLEQLGIATDLVTGGGTGTFDIDASSGVYTELQVGSYVFMDSQYQKLRHSSTCPRFEASLFVQAAVCSANHNGFVTIDAGLKQLSPDAGTPVVRSRSGRAAEFAYMGDEHGKVTSPSRQRPFELGDRVDLVVPHCDPTVNLHNFIHCMRGDVLEDIWRVDARGK